MGWYFSGLLEEWAAAYRAALEEVRVAWWSVVKAIAGQSVVNGVPPGAGSSGPHQQANDSKSSVRDGRPLRRFDRER